MYNDTLMKRKYENHDDHVCCAEGCYNLAKDYYWWGLADNYEDHEDNGWQYTLPYCSLKCFINSN